MKKTKRKGKSTQDLIGIKTFTKNGLKVGKDELVFFMVQPTNISVLSHSKTVFVHCKVQIRKVGKCVAESKQG